MLKMRSIDCVYFNAIVSQRYREYEVYRYFPKIATLLNIAIASYISNSHFETNFGYCSAVGAAIPKIGFLKGSLRLPFKKPIFIMRIADLISQRDG